MDHYIDASKDQLAFLTKSLHILAAIKDIVIRNEPNEEEEIMTHLALFEEEF
ncbi:hypothetical protein GQR36_17020 [Enterococcus termitis]